MSSRLHASSLLTDIGDSVQSKEACGRGKPAGKKLVGRAWQVKACSITCIHSRTLKHLERLEACYWATEASVRHPEIQQNEDKHYIDVKVL
jgi:hypothetical protein